MIDLPDGTGPWARGYRPRVIPVLLLKDGLLYKTQRFRKPKYVGDPRVALKIFNDKGADEVVILDIAATREGRRPDFRLIEELAGECFMPLGYGGGVGSRADVRTILGLGVEKVVVNTAAIEHPDLVPEIAADNGSQSVTVCIDVKRDLFGRVRVMTRGGRARSDWSPVALARHLEAAGAGELIVNAVDRDGTMAGYDIGLIRSVADAVNLPVIGLGGAGSETDLVRVVRDGGASAAAAGAMFVFQGPHRAVLITYPDETRLAALLGDATTSAEPA